MKEKRIMEKSTSALIISIKMLSTYVPIFILLNLLVSINNFELSK